jgi:hypothetical protein
MDAKSKRKRKEIDINTELVKRLPWLWKIDGYKIDGDANKRLVILLQDNFRILWKNVTNNERFNFDRITQMIEKSIIYIINNEEEKEWRYFNVKGKWKDDDLVLFKQMTLFDEQASGVMMMKLWK